MTALVFAIAALCVVLLAASAASGPPVVAEEADGSRGLLPRDAF